MLGPGEIADLTSCVHRLHRLPGESVPEPDAPVRGSSPAGQKPVLVGGPRDGLHSRDVICVGMNGLGGVQIPDKQLVVVSARCQVLIVGGPL